MKFLILLSVILTSFLCYGKSYKYNPGSDYPFLIINEIGKKLNSSGLIEFDLKKRGRVVNGFIDQIYVNPQAPHEMAVLILGLGYTAKAKSLKLSANEFVCHSATSSAQEYSLYVKGKTAADFSILCDRLRESELKEPTAFLLQKLNRTAQLLIPSAMANTACDSRVTALGLISGVSTSLNENVIIQQLGTCLSSSLRGAVGTVEGLTESLKNTFIGLLKDPRTLWSEVSEQATALKNFVLHLKTEVIELKQAFQGADLEQLIDLGCHIAGEFLATAGISALTGSGLVKMSIYFKNTFEKLKQSKTLLTRLKFLKAQGQGALADKVLSCVVK